MKFFSFDWFRSEERKKLDKLLVKEAELRIEILEEEKERIETPIFTPYLKLINNNGNVTAILRNATQISKADVSAGEFIKIREAETEEELIRLMSTVKVIPVPTTDWSYSPEELNIIENYSHVLSTDKDFDFKNDNVYLVGVALPIEPIVLASFIEVGEKLKIANNTGGDTSVLNEYMEALKMFWRWTALNPIEASRRDLYTFIRKNDIKITTTGLLELFRRVVTVGTKADKALVEFISNQYFKVKQQKKGPKNYFVVETSTPDVEEQGHWEKGEWWDNDDEDGDGGYYEEDEWVVDVPAVKGKKEYKLVKEVGDNDQLVGNLDELYIELPNMQQNRYTDKYSGKMDIRVGSVYKEDESKINLDNTVECSRGLHVGSRAFMFNSFGDTGVVALVNPSKVRSVPIANSYKMRVSEMFIAGVVDLDDYKAHVDANDLNNYSQEYFNISVEELEEKLAAQDYGGLSCQGNEVAMPTPDIEALTAYLKTKVVNI